MSTGIETITITLTLARDLRAEWLKATAAAAACRQPNKSGIETVDVRRALNDFVHLSDFILDSSEKPSQLYY